MTILQKPETINLSGNLVDFILSSSSAVSFVLKQDTRVLFEGNYTPNDNQRIEIDVKDIIEADLKAVFSDSSEPYEQSELVKTYTAEIAEQTHTFTVIKAGVDRLATSAANFLKANWLTWQPQVKKVTYYLPEFLTFYSVEASVVKVKAYFQQPDGGYSEETKQLLSIVAGKAYTVPVQYAVIAGKFESRLPAFYDVWFETVDGVRLSYIQRYVSSGMMGEDESWIVFENSLGGFDTFRAYGQLSLTADHDHQLAEIGDITDEYNVDTTREFQKNTGYLADHERKWLLDFFPSRQKYLYSRNYLRRIVVTEDDTSYTAGELPSSYTFNYRFADAKPYLNLQRVEELPSDLTISIPDLSSFTIPPRLVEFPSQNLTEGVMFPVQNPYSESWATTTIGAILSYIMNKIIEVGGDGTGGVGHTHGNFDVLKALEYIDGYLTHNGQKIKAGYADVAWEIDEKNDIYMRKDREELTNFLVRFLSGIFVGEFIDSLNNGKGAGIYPDGSAQFEKIEVRSAIVAKEIIYNRWFAQEGNVTYSEAGTIERIEQLQDGTYDIYLRRRWDNDITALAENDVCFGSVNNLMSTGEYYDSWFRVLNVMQAENKLNVVLYPDEEVPGGVNHAPEPLMVITRRGNPVNTERQGFWYISSYEGCICYLDGITKPILEESNYSIIIGKLKRLELFTNLPINYLHSYMYCRGIAVQDIHRIDYQGVIVRQENSRGFWSLEVAQSDKPYTQTNEYYDSVSHYGCEWMCLVTGTTEEPKYGCAGWAMIRGNPSFTIDIDSTQGWQFDFDRIADKDESGDYIVFTTLQVTGQLYNQDVTDDILDSDVTWARDTGNVTEDNAWAIKRAAAGKNLTLTLEDLGTDYINRTACSFKATALLRDGQQYEIAENYVTF